MNGGVAELTVSEKVLLSAYALEEAGQSPFTAEALIVHAWKQDPAGFGLRGFTEQYPDSNKVLAAIMGERGLARKGHFVKVGQKVYALSREGRLTARRILSGEEPPPSETPTPQSRQPKHVKLTRDQEKQLQSLLASTALAKFREDRQSELTFADACRFWGITENLRADLLDKRLEHLKTSLGDLDRKLQRGSAVLGGGREVSSSEVARLEGLNNYLLQRFSRHLNLLRTRTERP